MTWRFWSFGIGVAMALATLLVKADTGVTDNAPPVVFYAGLGEECCGEDPHAVHGVQTPDGGYVLAGRSIDSGQSWQGFAVKIGPPDLSGTVFLSKGEKNSYSWSVAFGEAGAKDGVNHVAATENAVFLAGFTSVSDGSQDAYLAKHDLATGKRIWEFRLAELMPGTSSAFEVLQVTPNGGLLAAGLSDAPKDALEGFKSYGNPAGGTATVVYFSPEDAKATTAPAKPSWKKTYGQWHTVKGARVVPGSPGGYVLLTHKEGGAPTLVRTDEQGEPIWTQAYPERGEPTDVAVVAVDGMALGFAFVGHGGQDMTLDGRLTKVDLDGKEQWSQVFGNPVGGVGKFAGLDAGNPKLIYDECWSVQATPDGGLITGCGTGIEGCDGWPEGSAVRKECDSDPRRDWRSMITRFDATGKQLWQRVDSYPSLNGEPVTSTACEYVALTQGGGVMSVADEAFGLGLMVLAPMSHGGGGGGGGNPTTSTSSAGSDNASNATPESGGCSLSSRGTNAPQNAIGSLLFLAALLYQRRKASPV